LDETGFQPELVELLDDPITHRVMASDKVDMASLVALLRTARRRLKQTGVAAPARRHGRRPKNERAGAWPAPANGGARARRRGA
jgi:hypothetical protein